MDAYFVDAVGRASCLPGLCVACSNPLGINETMLDGQPPKNRAELAYRYVVPDVWAPGDDAPKGCLRGATEEPGLLHNWSAAPSRRRRGHDTARPRLRDRLPEP